MNDEHSLNQKEKKKKKKTIPVGIFVYNQIKKNKVK